MRTTPEPTARTCGRGGPIAAPLLFRRTPLRATPPAPFLPTTRREMDALGWDACDVVIVTGDAYVDHPSFGMALVGRLLEAQGFRVGVLPQPEWSNPDPFRELGRPRLYFGVTAGNMDSMVNRYTSDARLRSDDAYTPDGAAGARPDRAVLVYTQRCREAFPGVPVVIGGIEASLRRVAHYDYWSDKVRRSVLFDAKADLLLYGNAERALVELTWRLAEGESIAAIRDLRGSAFATREARPGWRIVDLSALEDDGPKGAVADATAGGALDDDRWVGERGLATAMRAEGIDGIALRVPSFEAVSEDGVLYAHASRLLHLESNPHNARALVQRHGDRDLWLNPPPIPLATVEMDHVYGRPFARVPHPRYGDRKIPAYEMIRFSVTIQRGCFGGCTFCSITEHEGRIVQNRSEESVLREIAELRDRLPGFTGVISDLGGPTANMYRIACRAREIESACRRPSCVFPRVCENLVTDHSALIQLYRKAREIPGIRKVLIASGVRYDLAIRDPRYVTELATHHVGGYLKVAPEHVSEGVLSKMMKPGIGAWDEFRALFERASTEAGLRQYLIPYFIAAHPGTRDEDMLELALWLKRNRFRPDQVQAFLPSPMSTATAMYRSGRNPLRRITRGGELVPIPRGLRARRLHKAFLRYHDPANWPLLREALERMGRADLIGQGPDCLVPRQDPSPGAQTAPVRRERGRAAATQQSRRDRGKRGQRR